MKKIRLRRIENEEGVEKQNRASVGEGPSEVHAEVQRSRDPEARRPREPEIVDWSSNLAFDIHSFESFLFRALEETTSFTSEKLHFGVCVFFKKHLAIVFANKPCTFVVGLKAELFSDET